jgi:hypothetical protein
MEHHIQEKYRVTKPILKLSCIVYGFHVKLTYTMDCPAAQVATRYRYSDISDFWSPLAIDSVFLVFQVSPFAL